MTFTINPTIEWLQYGGYGSLALGTLSFGYWFYKGPANWTPKAKAAGWIGLVLLVVGGLSFPIRYDLQGRRDYKAEFAKLQPEWKDFYKQLDSIKNRELRAVALARFLHVNPPRLTVNQHRALIGSMLCQRTPTMRMIEDTHQVAGLVDFDFEKETP